MKIAIYARVSSETQAKEGTIESQIEALKDYANTHNLSIAFECIDDGYSGTTLIRPGLDQLRDLAQAGSIEGVLILSPDRLSRKQANQILLMEEFEKQDVRVIFTNQNFDNTPEGNFMLNIHGIISEYERIKIIDRTRRGTMHAVKNGQIIGCKAPFGYSFIHKRQSIPAHWEVNPDEAKIVELIFDLYTNKRMKVPSLVNYLEKEKIPNRSIDNKWWTASIYNILKNETYIGNAHMYKTMTVEPVNKIKSKKYRKHIKSSTKPRPREEWISIPVHPIITPEVFQRAQILLKENAIQSRRNNSKNKYLLRGLVVCGICGCMATGCVSNRYSYYKCMSKTYGNIRTKLHNETVKIYRSFLDEKIWNGLVELLNDPHNIQEQLEKRLAEKPHYEAKRIDPKRARKELDNLTFQEKRITDAYREGVISLLELREQKEKIREKRTVLEGKIKAALSQPEGLEQPKITLAMLGDVSSRFRHAMKNADFEKREKLVRVLVSSVKLYPTKAVVEGSIPLLKNDALMQGNYGIFLP